MTGQGSSEGGEPVAFDPSYAHTATTWGEAIELARAWADGRRSWVSLGHALDVVAIMDAQEVVKWTAMAAALAQLEAIRHARESSEQEAEENDAT